jgi:hypothetical protein
MSSLKSFSLKGAIQNFNLRFTKEALALALQ